MIFNWKKRNNITIFKVLCDGDKALVHTAIELGLKIVAKWNDVTLTGQNPSLKYCQPLGLVTQFKADLDL